MPIYDATDSDSQTSDPQKHDTNDDVFMRRSPILQDNPSGRTSPSTVFNPYYTGLPSTPVGGFRSAAVHRQEIIRRIKSRDDRSRPTSPEIERLTRAESREDVQAACQSQEGEGVSKPESERETDNLEIGLQIERPRSALHRGDFREKEGNIPFSGESQEALLSTSPPAPWHPQFPASTFRQAWDERRLGRVQSSIAHPYKQRTASINIAGHPFVYQAPTSPLVQSSRPDTPPPYLRQSSRSPDKQSRRHTFSPNALQRLATEYDVTSSKAKPTLRKEATYPYQAHQPRRSLHALNASASGSPPRSALSSRRPSVSSEAHSPLLHAPLVGSYEESILRGRMSTTPSKPLNFIAQIGVLGKGHCKPSLRCPSHVTVPFPAVFYSYGASQRQGTSDQPSPYVGLIDLENGLANHESGPDRRRQRLNDRLQGTLDDHIDHTSEDASTVLDTSQARLRRQEKQKRRSNSPKAPPGGSYRIPQQGQLQIVIKNPNKTAVKLFLVPYDLIDMIPGQKTFIRQRSYSAGPIIDMPLASRKNLGTDRPEASLPNGDDPNDRPVLRYLVHLHICCTVKGRYWLYKSIRVVFANRVPDGKEKLRNEIQLPDPRYSTYKPGRDSIVATSQPSSPSTHGKRQTNISGLLDHRTAASSLPTGETSMLNMAAFQFPFRAPLLPTLESRPSSSHTNEPMDIDSDRTQEPLSPTSSRGTLERPISPWSPVRGLQQEPLLFERGTSRERTDGRESLLSQKLKNLDM